MSGGNGIRYTTAQFIEAIKSSGGIITAIAERVGCSWNTAQHWIKTYPTVKAAYDDECERINDMAQSILMKSIKDGNTQDAKWWLSKKRKQEFGESVDVTSGGEPLKGYVVVSPDDWDKDER